MAKVSTNIRIDSDTKIKAQQLLDDLGLDLSTAINIFLKQMVYENAIPFSISRDVPNVETLEAMREADDIIAHPEAYKSYDSAEEMVRDILGEA